MIGKKDSGGLPMKSRDITVVLLKHASAHMDLKDPSISISRLSTSSCILSWVWATSSALMETWTTFQHRSQSTREILLIIKAYLIINSLGRPETRTCSRATLATVTPCPPSTPYIIYYLQIEDTPVSCHVCSLDLASLLKDTE